MAHANLSRRNLLKGAFAVGGGGLIVATAGGSVRAASSKLPAKNMPVPYTNMFRRPPVLMPIAEGVDDKGPWQRYRVTQKSGLAAIAPGLTTTVTGFNGIFPGPTIKAKQGTRVELRVANALTMQRLNGRPFRTVTHLHGSASLPQYDGYANDSTAPGYCKTYKYPNWQPARTLWYHDHEHGMTAENVYAGLAALYTLSDPYEQAQLPQGEFDVPLMISDIAFNANGSLAFDDDSHEGVMGDIILVNGVPWPKMKVKPRVYRFRVLAAAISRSFRFTLSNGEPVTMVATDGGMMPKPQILKSWRHGVAERYEILIDFRKYKPGTRIELRNLSNKNNVDFKNTDKIMQFEVVAGSGPADPYVMPTTLDCGPQPYANRGARHVDQLTPAMSKARRKLSVERKHGLWTINGETWEDVQRSGFKRVLGNPQPYDVEIWDLENRSGGWFHPLHIHLVDGRILARDNTSDGKPYAWELGAKDTFYLGENETVSVIMQFVTGDGNDGGRYMTHCHNLVHEDSDMMIQFAVGDATMNDPISSDRPIADGELEQPVTYGPSYPLGT